MSQSREYRDALRTIRDALDTIHNEANDADEALDTLSRNDDETAEDVERDVKHSAGEINSLVGTVREHMLEIAASRRAIEERESAIEELLASIETRVNECCDAADRLTD